MKIRCFFCKLFPKIATFSIHPSRFNGFFTRSCKRTKIKQDGVFQALTDPFADVLGLLADRLGVADGMVSDGGEQFLLVLAVKWGLAHQHLIQQHAIGPPVALCYKSECHSIMSSSRWQTVAVVSSSLRSKCLSLYLSVYLH